MIITCKKQAKNKKILQSPIKIIKVQKQALLYKWIQTNSSTIQNKNNINNLSKNSINNL